MMRTGRNATLFDKVKSEVNIRSARRGSRRLLSGSPGQGGWVMQSATTGLFQLTNPTDASIERAAAASQPASVPTERTCHPASAIDLA
jgi:hypothetical protein